MRSWRRILKTELAVQNRSITVSHETHIGAPRRIVAKLLHEPPHDSESDALSLIIRMYGDIHDLVEEPTIADDTTHADEPVGRAHAHRITAAGQAALSGFALVSAQTSENTEFDELIHSWYFVCKFHVLHTHTDPAAIFEKPQFNKLIIFFRQKPAIGKSTIFG